MRQVHGSQVVVVHQAEGQPEMARPDMTMVGDAMVSNDPEACLAVLTADCAPVAMASPEGIMAVAHAGWRGLLAGVIARTASVMRDLGATTIRAGLGPCIHAGCNEFSSQDLDRAVAVVGEEARGTTTKGRPALDLPAAVRSCLGAAGVDLVAYIDRCTACSEELFSYRARGQAERQAVVVWRPRLAELSP